MSLRATRQSLLAPLLALAALCGCGGAFVDGAAALSPAPANPPPAAVGTVGDANGDIPTPDPNLPASDGNKSANPPLTLQALTVDANPNALVGPFVSIVTHSSAVARCLDLRSGVALLQPCDGSTLQTWTFAAGQLSTQGARCLAVNGNNLALAACATADSNQRWASADGVLQAGTLCLSLQDNANAAGSTVGLAPCYPTDAAQQWALANDANGVLHGAMLGAGDSNQCLDIKANVVNANATIDVYACNGTRAQQWTFDSGMIRAGAYCLTVGSAAQNNALVLSACDVPNHLWVYSAGQVHISGSTACLTQPVSLANSQVPTVTRCVDGAANQQWTLGARRAL